MHPTHRTKVLLVSALICSALVSKMQAADETVTGNLSVTGLLDVDGNSVTFGTQSGSFGAGFTYTDHTTDTLRFFVNRAPGSWLWENGAGVAMRLSDAHKLSLYQADGTTIGASLDPVSNTLSLGAATLYRDSGGALKTDGAFVTGGNFTAPSFTTGSITGGASGLTLNSGGANQNILLNPNGTGQLLVSGDAPTIKAVGANKNLILSGADNSGSVVVKGPSVADAWAVLNTVPFDAGGSSAYSSAPAGSLSATNPAWFIGHRYGAQGPLSFWKYDGTHYANAMTLTAGGALLLGTATSSGNGRIQLAAHSTQSGGIGFGTTESLGLFQVSGYNIGVTAGGQTRLTMGLSSNGLGWGGITRGTDSSVLFISGGSSEAPSIGASIIAEGINSGGALAGGRLILRTAHNGAANNATIDFVTSSGTLQGRFSKSGSLLLGTTVDAASSEVPSRLVVSGPITLQVPEDTITTRSIVLQTDNGGTGRQNARIDFSKTTANATRNSNIGLVTYSGNVATTALGLNGGGTATIGYTTASTSPTTGALVVNGGVGVAGNLNVAGSVSASSGTITGGSTGLNLVGSWGGNLNVTLSPSGSGHVILNGNVGVGVAAPSAKLEVSGTAQFRDTTVIGYGGSIQPTLTRDGGTGGLVLASQGTGAGGDFIYKGNDGNGALTERFRVNGYTGNVGIGANSPQARLTVAGSSNGSVLQNIVNANTAGYTAIHLSGADDNSATGAYLHSFGGAYSGNGAFAPGSVTLSSYNANGLNLHAANSSLRIYTGGFAAANERLAITSTGNVGIGTNAPAEKLEVAGNAKVTGTMKVVGAVRFEGTVRIPQQGDLSMGDFISEP